MKLLAITLITVGIKFITEVITCLRTEAAATHRQNTPTHNKCQWRICAQNTRGPEEIFFFGCNNCSMLHNCTNTVFSELAKHIFKSAIQVLEVAVPPVHEVRTVATLTSYIHPNPSNEVSICHATNELPRNSFSSYGFPSNKFVKVWACIRYVKYPPGIMTVPKGRSPEGTIIIPGGYLT